MERWFLSSIRYESELNNHADVHSDASVLPDNELRSIAAEARKVYSRIINRLSRELVVSRSIRYAGGETMNIFGPTACAGMLSDPVPERHGQSPVARPAVIHSTSARLNATDS